MSEQRSFQEYSLRSQLSDFGGHLPGVLLWVLRHKRLIFNHFPDGPFSQNAYHLLQKMVSDEEALGVLHYTLFSNHDVEETLSPRGASCMTAVVYEIATGHELDDYRFTGILYLSAMMRIFDDFVDDINNRAFFLNPSVKCRDMLMHDQIKSKIIPLLHGLQQLLFAKDTNENDLLSDEKKQTVLKKALSCFEKAFQGVHRGAYLLNEQNDAYSLEEVSRYRRDTTDQFAALASEIIGTAEDDERFLQIFTNLIDYFQIFEDITDLREDMNGKAFNYLVAAIHESGENPDIPFSKETHPLSYQKLVSMANEKIINVFGYVPFYLHPDEVMSIVGWFGNPSKTDRINTSKLRHLIRFFHQW